MANNLNYWLLIILAGLFEVGWAIGLKYSEGFTKFYPSVITVICIILSMGLLAYCMKFLPVGTAYAVWTGIGAAGTAILGIYLFNEPANFSRLLFIGFIIIGIIGLKFTA